MEPGSQMGAPEFSVKMNARINETGNVIHIWQAQLLSVIITDAYKMLLTNMNEIL